MGAAASAAEADAGAPSERRLVSVLFVDLEGFTSITESLDPEDVRNLQSRYFEAARSVIAHYRGTLEKFIGDAVMAVWGAPTAHEDDGERAVRAALELVAMVGKLRGAESDRRLAARAAVATGEAAVTLGLEGQGIVAGDLVNTAARLQAEAPAGGVLVDDTTRRVVGDAIDFVPAGQATLKGKRRAVTTWRAERLAAERLHGRGAGHAGLFVGRDRELGELLDLERRTRETGRSRVVSIVGIAGIGKSRLMWEFEHRLEEAPHTVALHLGRAPSYGEGITFAPIAEMVRRRARIAEGTETELARRQLARTLVELVPDEVERAWIEPRLATLLDPGAPVAYERDELFAAWRRFFERVSDWAPALLVFEDLQWADPALLDFIDHMATWSRSHPILIVTLARPELLDRRPDWGASQHSFTAIHLEPLPDADMSELLRGLAPGLPEQTLARIVQGAGGVPLYGVEVLRMLVDQGQARLTDGGVEVLDPHAEVQVPETLHSLVSARIDALPSAERSVLLSASVLGRRFHPDAVAAISDLDPVDARQRIASLVRRELVTIDDEPRSPGRGQLSFVQDVVRDVAYRTVSRRDRRRLHLAAADVLEELGDEELVEAIAEHLVEAHGAAPDRPDAPTVARRAVAALHVAARRALSLRVPDRALGHLERAIALVDDDAARADLWMEAALAARSAGRFDRAEDYLRQVIDWRAAHAEPGEAARARAQLASLLLATERPGSALGDLEKALEGIGDLATDPASAALGGQLARARVLVGDDAEALAWADRTITAAESLGQDAVAVDALITRGTAHMRLGHDAEGLADLELAVASAERQGLIGAELRARNNLAWLVVQDDPHAAMETARTGLELAVRMGVGDMALQLAVVVAGVGLDTGDWDEALRVLAEVHDRPQAPAHRLQFIEGEAIIRALRGEDDAAAIAEAQAEQDAATDPQILAGLAYARAWSAFVRGDPREARRLADGAADELLGSEQHAALVLSGRASLWLEDRVSLDTTLGRIAELGLHGRSSAAAEETLRAGAEALAGEQRAGALYDQAVAAWWALRLPLHLALALCERARWSPGASAESRRADEEEAEAIASRLEARGLAEAFHRLSSAAERWPSG